MTYEQSSALSFSIKEAIWLNRGNEIDEILSLALEPDISIREVDDQVFVRGSLQLFGEYRPKDEEASRTKPGSLSRQVSFRSVEEVSMTDDGIGMIRHSFPLDVTIPRDRIDNIEDLYVTVDAFDYELPGEGCIELEANVSVSGIKSDRNESYQMEEPEDTTYDNSYGDLVEESDEEVNEEPVEVNEVEREEDHVTEQEVEEDSKSEYFMQEENEPKPNDDTVEEGHFHLEAVRQASASDETYEKEEHSSKDENQGIIDFQGLRSDNEEEYVREKDVEPTVTFSAFQQPAEATDEENDDEIQLQSDDDGRFDQDEEAPEQTKEKEENALYLTKMLTKGEEDFSKLRMCIIQDGESLETIAERYDIQVSHLVRMNRLNEERVSQGQLLYIPVRQKPSSNS